MSHLQTLKDFNTWRRSDEDMEQPHPKAIGEAIDWAIAVCVAAQKVKAAKGRFNTEMESARLFQLLQ